LPEVAADEQLWELAEADFLVDISNRYEADFAFAFWHSLRRMLLQNEWKPVSYEAGETEQRLRSAPRSVLKRFHDTLPIGPDVVRAILEIPAFSVKWRDLDADAVLVGEAIAEMLEQLHPREGEPARIEIADSGFFRDRGACLVGRICLGPHNGTAARSLPLLIALLNDKDGLFVDAVLGNTDELQYAFSSTLANFHSTSPYYHELAQFLFELMPRRPLGLHYSTIGFHHLGKVAVMTEILFEHRRSKEKLDTAPGFKGTVAIGFTMPSSGYVLKIIRDHPTDDYKWDRFDGVDTVLSKYRLVHEIDRAGSMLDNIIYSRVKLDRTLFAPDLLDELLEAGVGTVSLDRSAVVFRHLIVQVKLTPLPLFLQTATPEQARIAAINLGDCIKNNAAANIFNKDLDGRNYGVSKILKVYLFDYDAVGPLTDVKVRTNADREEGEEGIPEWFFEQGNIFLPEEIVAGLRIDDPGLRRAFRDAHPELLRLDYWEGMQRALREGKVPKVMNYPAARRLRR
jgi:isocitrate dehydrogenase kinase/phosphatase